MNREEFLRRLHPAIVHVKYSDNMDEETLEAINAMVDKVFHMSKDEIKSLAKAGKEFRDYEKEVVKEAEHYPELQRCNGRLNEEILRSCMAMGFSPRQTCNALMDSAST